jgi:hypothetical protein
VVRPSKKSKLRSLCDKCLVFTRNVHFTPLEEQCHKPKNAHFELCPQEVCLRPYLPSGIASHDYFLKCPREGRSVVLLMRLHRPGQWFFLSPEKLYFSSCDSVLLGGAIYVFIKVFMVFLLARTNAELVSKVFVALHVSPPNVISNFHPNAVLHTSASPRYRIIKIKIIQMQFSTRQHLLITELSKLKTSKCSSPHVRIC